MAEYKKQHYVPKLYLRNFTVDGRFLSVYNILKRSLHSRVPYDTQCYKDYYYGKDKIWETRLSTLEAEWAIVFQKILAEEALSNNDINLVREFALYQLQRTVAANEHLLRQREEVICEFGRILYNREGMDFDSVTEEICKERAKHACSPAESLAFSEKSLPFVHDLELAIIKYNTVQDLITSDAPVIAINPFHHPSIGYNCMGLILLFPISNKKLVVLYDAKMYPKNRGGLYIENSDEGEVANLNALQFISADKILLSMSDRSFIEIPNNVWEAREKNKALNTATALGSEDNRIVALTPRRVFYRCDFSFGAVCHRFKRIPFVCKEAPPRYWDSAWDKKLEMKAQFFGNIIELTPGLSSQYGLTKKEIRRGCQRMANAAKYYWMQNQIID